MRDNEKVGNILELPVPFWKIKVENTRLLAEKVDQGKIARISIVNGAFFEWGAFHSLFLIAYAFRGI